MNTRANRVASLVVTVLMVANVNAIAEEGNTFISWSTGIEYSSGTYGGTADIEDFYVPIIARIGYERVSFELTVPYLSVRAPAGTILPEPGNEPVSGSGPTTTESGLGDVIAGVTLYDVFYSGEHDIALDLTGKIKFGTADESKGLGTGEQDYTLRADLFKFFEQFTLLGSAGYKLRGDPPGLDLKNVLLGSVGGVYSMTEKSRLGLIYDYRESALADGDAVSELSVFLSRSLTDSWQIQFYVFTGFTESSADRGAGILFHII